MGAAQSSNHCTNCRKCIWGEFFAIESKKYRSEAFSIICRKCYSKYLNRIKCIEETEVDRKIKKLSDEELLSYVTSMCEKDEDGESESSKKTIMSIVSDTYDNSTLSDRNKMGVFKMRNCLIDKLGLKQFGCRALEKLNCFKTDKDKVESHILILLVRFQLSVEKRWSFLEKAKKLDPEARMVKTHSSKLRIYQDFAEHAKWRKLLDPNGELQLARKLADDWMKSKHNLDFTTKTLYYKAGIITMREYVESI